MNRPRISILGVMGFILVAGLVLALVRAERGIVSSTLELWANLTSYLTVASLVIATYSARYREGTAADWWFGFALGGWSYYVLAGDMMWHWNFNYHRTHWPNSLVMRLPHCIVENINYYCSLPLDHEVDSYLHHIAQAILMLLAAAAGGSVCLLLSWQKRRRSGDGIRTDLRCGAECRPPAEP